MTEYSPSSNSTQISVHFPGVTSIAVGICDSPSAPLRRHHFACPSPPTKVRVFLCLVTVADIDQHDCDCFQYLGEIDGCLHPGCLGIVLLSRVCNAASNRYNVFCCNNHFFPRSFIELEFHRPVSKLTPYVMQKSTPGKVCRFLCWFWLYFSGQSRTVADRQAVYFQRR